MPNTHNDFLKLSLQLYSCHCPIRQGKLDDLGEHFEEQEEGGEEEARPGAEDERGGRVQP